MTTLAQPLPRYTFGVFVESVHGSHGAHDQSDLDRAVDAAEAVLETHGVDARAAFAAYCEVSNGADRTPASDAWEAASRAADLAFTTGWHDPNAAFVDIYPN